jgi:hypothetical protein
MKGRMNKIEQQIKSDYTSKIPEKELNNFHFDPSRRTLYQFGSLISLPQKCYQDHGHEVNIPPQLNSLWDDLFDNQL